MFKQYLYAVLVVWFCSLACLAQKNEASLTLGTTFVSDQTGGTVGWMPPTCIFFHPPVCPAFNVTIKTSHGFAIEGNFARRIVGLGSLADLYVEAPLVGVVHQMQNTTATNTGPYGFPGTTEGSTPSSALFFTPSAKVKLLPKSKISPFVSVGGGFAHYTSQWASLVNSVSIMPQPPQPPPFKPALQFGGGVDWKTPFPLLSLRGEVRDFFTGNSVATASIGGTTTQFGKLVPNNSNIHNILVSGGVVFRF